MTLDDATNPVADDDNSQETVADDTGVDNESHDDEQELDADGDPVADDDSEEIEHDGKKYAVPKALKPLMLMQADYTKKTQEVATERAAVKAEREALHQTSQAELEAFATAKSLDQQVAYYARIDWAGWHQQANQQLRAARATYDDNLIAQAEAAVAEVHTEKARYDQSKDAYQQALGQLSNLRGQRLSTAQQETATRIEQGREVLTREVAGWNDELKAKLITFAAGYGFSRDDLSDLEADPRVAKVLHAAFTGSEASRKAKTAQSHVAAQAVVPAAKVGTAKAPVSGLDDRLSPDEWMRRRNAQVRKRA